MEEKKNDFEGFNLLKMDPEQNPFDDGMDIKFNMDDNANLQSVKDNVKTKLEEEEEQDDTNKGNDLETKDEIVNDKKSQTSKSNEPKEKKPVKTEPVDQDEEQVTNTQDDTTDDNTLTVFGEYLHNEGLINLEEGKKIESEDDLRGAIQNEIKSGVENYISSKSEDVQQFLEFVDAGGNPRDFHQLYYESRSWSDIDPSKESNQELIVREALALSGWDEEDIEAEITDKKDLGKLGPLAEKFHKKLVSSETQNKQALIEAQKELNRKHQEEVQKQWTEFKDNFYNMEDLNGFKLNSKMKDDLWNFMSKPDRKTGKTGLQLHNETNTKAQYLYAYLAYNNWDITKLEKQVKNKVVSELADKLKKTSTGDSRNKISKGTNNNLNDENKTNNFSSFRQALNNNQI